MLRAKKRRTGPLLVDAVVRLTPRRAEAAGKRRHYRAVRFVKPLSLTKLDSTQSKATLRISFLREIQSSFERLLLSHHCYLRLQSKRNWEQQVTVRYGAFQKGPVSKAAGSTTVDRVYCVSGSMARRRDHEPF